jgi:diguanylate cyclase (GGDEF)-like protein
MSFARACLRLPGRLTLTQRVALMSLVPMVVLGFVLTRVIEQQVESHSVADAAQSARLIASIGIQPRLTPRELRVGLTPAQIGQLDEQLRARSTTDNLARVKIWDTHHAVIYSDDHTLIGHHFSDEDDLEKALEGQPSSGEVVTPTRGGETASEVGLGKLVEVYVPLRFARTGPTVGAFEIYLSYRPIAAAIAHDKRLIVLVVAIGLALLWAVLFRIVAQASRRLRRQADDNYLLAHFDPLTGLPNRTLFRERVAETMRRGDVDRDAMAILLIDLDGFTQINGTLGNDTGDTVLRETAERLQAQFGGDTLIGRIGADEYAILCPHAEGVTGALKTAARVHDAMEPAITAEEIAINVDTSIGLAVLEGEDEDLDELMRHADTALARARATHSRVEVYSRRNDSFDPAGLLLLGQVRQGLDRDEFELHYQPKIELASGRVSGVEALIRWRHPEHGLLMPIDFIGLIEQTALVDPVTQRVVERALEQMVRWCDQGIDLRMSVNLSARNLLDPRLPDQISALLRRHGVPAARLTVEVTERVAMADPARAVEVLCELRERGLGVSIDDFGTGNASLAYLAQLPANEIKIDKSFITGLCEDTRAGAIASSTIDLARHLDLHVVAEGIETQGVLERLVELGCDTGQGYLISRPLAGSDVTAWLLVNAGVPYASAVHASATELSVGEPSSPGRPSRGLEAARRRSSARSAGL